MPSTYSTLSAQKLIHDNYSYSLDCRTLKRIIVKSKILSVAILFFIASFSVSIAKPVVDWRTKCGLTEDAINQSRAFIAAKLDDVKVSFQDWKRGEVDRILVTKTLTYAGVSVQHELEKVAIRVLSFLDNQQKLGTVSENEVTKLKEDFEKAAGDPFSDIMRAFSALTDTMNHFDVPVDLQGSEEQVAETFDQVKKVLLGVVDKAFKGFTDVFSAKFDN
ncbi:hypothetical protein HDE_01030 [Halotydeus destructor]|nr:hypothetical protein HDE_01030 [Halotydeus destructor]